MLLAKTGPPTSEVDAIVAEATAGSMGRQGSWVLVGGTRLAVVGGAAAKQAPPPVMERLAVWVWAAWKGVAGAVVRLGGLECVAQQRLEGLVVARAGKLLAELGSVS